jgi:hypothetical protein
MESYIDFLIFGSENPRFGNETWLDRHGAINCAIEQSSESGDNDLSRMAREARAPSEIHPNPNDW